jgi:hypothetical protein
MSVKQIGLSCLVVALSGLGAVHAQCPVAAPASADVLPLYSPGGSDAGSPYGPVPAMTPASGQVTTASAPAGTTAEGIAIDEGRRAPPSPAPVPLGLPASPYLNYPHSPCCCGEVGRCGPLGYELFFRSGMSFPIGGGIFNQFLHTGWDVEGGARLLLFNPPATAAWTVTFSVSNIFSRTGNANQPVTLFRFPVHTTVTIPAQPGVPGSVPITTPTLIQVPEVTATISSLNQTLVSAGLGREWWLLGSAYPGSQSGCNWRVGCDAGGRWGSGMLQFNEFQHHDDVIGGIYAAIHTDVEWIFRCGIPFAGVRFEYSYIWTSLLQDQNKGDYQSLNLLFQVGVRF